MSKTFLNEDLFIKKSANDECNMETVMRGLTTGGAFKRGIQNDEFRSEKNFHHLWANINQILSYKYNHPIVVGKETLEGVINEFAHIYDPQDTKYLNKRVIDRLQLMFQTEQREIQIANEWDEEEFDVLTRNTETSYNPNTAGVRTTQDRPIAWVEM